MIYFGHSGNCGDRSDWQRLDAHLLNVARLSGSFGEKIGLARAAYVAGLFHDLGKYDPAFQAYIAGQGASVDHSTAGAKVLRDLAQGPDKAVAEIIAYAILGHHAGLPDRDNATGGSFNLRIGQPLRIADAWRNELGDDLAARISGMADNLTRFVVEDRERQGFALSFVGRMVFSCLVDADFRDTEAFYVSQGERQADRDWPPLQDLIPDFWERFEAHMAGLSGRSGTSGKGGALNDLRAHILSHVRSKATARPGLFTLTVPTGGGKTLASLGFALDHAKAHGHQRIIYAIPFTSIIDQAAAIFRSVLGDEHVLEHHSNIDEEKFQARERRDKLKLAMEDWAAPVIVTTNVQLFESLFSARPSRTRRLPRGGVDRNDCLDGSPVVDLESRLPRGGVDRNFVGNGGGSLEKRRLPRGGVDRNDVYGPLPVCKE
ncbi:CRISPR-associated endonuclease Cas3'' [Affinirhizobium pseudoryzae]|uniref:CRISPR-associated endonuclease Cas3'' n=1 Tax=Allorhizobium pseudoryzae TaxID=379684 RepID=UPI001F3A29EE|nr:CRISPR-associated endonuclease Cas3'' [Allorhizobium pseudoryzae]